MPQSLSQIYIHLVFSTYQRTPYLQNAELRGNLDAYLGGILKSEGCIPLAVKSQPDHIHLLFRLGRTNDIAGLVEAVKTSGTHWLKAQDPNLHAFHWQQGYAAFSVSHSLVETVRVYVLNQEEHHRQRSFHEELLLLLQKHDVPYDEHYLWD